jgi:alpha-beta hydrolase superfamily lysophospholipase
MDMRGHGLSDKPVAGYEDSKMWADDVNAVIETLELDHPVLCGWSCWPLVILDYIRHYGGACWRSSFCKKSVRLLPPQDSRAVAC